MKSFCLWVCLLSFILGCGAQDSATPDLTEKDRTSPTEAIDHSGIQPSDVVSGGQPNRSKSPATDTAPPSEPAKPKKHAGKTANEWLEAMASGDDPEAARTAKELLSRIGPSRSPADSHPGETAKWREQLRKADQPVLQLGPIAALGQIGPDAAAAVPDLVYLLQSTPEFDVRRQIISTLGKIGPGAAAARPTLMQMLEQERGKQKQNAIRALGSIGLEEQQSIKRVAQELHGDLVTASLASVTLSKFGADALPSVTNVLQDEGAEVSARCFAAVALGRIGVEAKSANAAIQAVIDEQGVSPTLRREAERALRQINLAEVKHPADHLPAARPISTQDLERVSSAELIKIVRNSDPKAGRDQCQRIGKILGQRSRKDLGNLLDQWKVSARGIRVLMLENGLTNSATESARLREFNALQHAVSGAGESAVPDLIDMLRDDQYVNVRAPIAKTLGEIGDPRAISPLNEAIDDGKGSEFFATVARVVIRTLEGEVTRPPSRDDPESRRAWLIRKICIRHPMKQHDYVRYMDYEEELADQGLTILPSLIKQIYETQVAEDESGLWLFKAEGVPPASVLLKLCRRFPDAADPRREIGRLTDTAVGPPGADPANRRYVQLVLASLTDELNEPRNKNHSDVRKYFGRRAKELAEVVRKEITESGLQRMASIWSQWHDNGGKCLPVGAEGVRGRIGN